MSSNASFHRAAFHEQRDKRSRSTSRRRLGAYMGTASRGWRRFVISSISLIDTNDASNICLNYPAHARARLRAFVGSYARCKRDGPAGPTKADSSDAARSQGSAQDLWHRTVRRFQHHPACCSSQHRSALGPITLAVIGSIMTVMELWRKLKLPTRKSPPNGPSRGA